MAENNAITSKQLVHILFAVAGVKIFTMPAIAVREAGPDAWLAVIGGMLFPFLALFIFERAASKLPVTSFTEMNRFLFGKWLGTVFVMVFVLYIIYLNVVMLRYSAVVTHIYLLPRTPLTVILAFYIIYAVYLGGKGVTVLGRVTELLFGTVVVLVGMMLYIAWIGGDYTTLLPVGSSGLPAIAAASVKTAWGYSGLELLFIYYWFVTRKEETLRAGMTTILLSGVFYLVTVITLILVFDVGGVNQSLWTIIILFKTQQLTLVERLDFFALMIWVGLAVRPVSILLTASYLPVRQMLGNKLQKYSLLMMSAVGLVVFVGAELIPNTLELEDLVKMGLPAVLAAQTGYPLLVYAATLIRGKGGKSSV